MSARRKYSLTIQAYSEAQQILPGYNSLQFINLGTSNAIINNQISLITNQTFTVEDEQDRECESQLSLSFDNTATNLCILVRKDLL
jgi:hypothetical protein